MLCKVCKEGLEGIWDPERTRRIKIDDESKNDQGSQFGPERWLFGHHLTRESFVASIEQGCVVCCKFAFLKDIEKPLNTQLKDVEYSSVFRVILNPRYVKMVVCYGDIYHVYDMIPHKGLDENLNFELGASTGDQTTWVLIERWLNRCLQGHPTCDYHHDEAKFIPSRLLELHTISSEKKMFRVVERQQIQPEERYITLSHCWGSTPSNPNLILLKDTFQSLGEYQPLSVLPKTFRDAFTIIERLRIRYIWIDRLCILQDSAEDWQRESAAMGQVYRNAFLGISALSSSNDAGGCFFSRDSAKVAPSIVNIPVDDSSDPKPFRFRGEKGWPLPRKFKQEPLPKRGWVLQERLLCPRVLHFGREQVFWECRECTCCETQPNNAYEHDYHPRRANIDTNRGYHDETSLSQPVFQYNHFWKQLLDAPRLRYSIDPRDPIYEEWYANMIVFSTCQLTAPSDKLVAISGLAKDVLNRLENLGYDKDVYLAGLWQQNLPGCLTWNILKPCRRPPLYRAPSWSWASVDGAVKFPDTDPVQRKTAWSLALVIGAECIPCGEDETGQVSSGTVTLKGPIASAKLIPSASNFEDTAMSVQSLEALEVEGHKTTVKYPPDLSKVIFDVKSEMRAEIYCLPIETYHMISNFWRLSGLALIRTGRGTYSRVGYVGMLHENEAAAKNFFSGFPEYTCVLE